MSRAARRTVIEVGFRMRGARRLAVASVAFALALPATAVATASPSGAPAAPVRRAAAAADDGLAALRADLAGGGTARVLATFTVDGSTRAARAADAGRRAAIATRARGIARAVERASERAAVVRAYRGVPALAAEIDAAAFEQLVAAPGVVSVRPERRLRPDVARAAFARPQLAQSVPRIDAQYAYDQGVTGTGEVIAILDSGVDGAHPMLTGKIAGQACYSTTSAADSSVSVCPGGAQASDTTGGGPCAVNGCEHGTHVAGIAAGREWNAPGALPIIRGVAYDADVHSIQVFSRFNSSALCFPEAAPCAQAFEGDLLAGFDRVLELSDTVDFAALNVSIGGQITTTSCPDDPAALLIEGLTAAGVPVVVASGNDGFYNAISHPSCVPDAIAVASTNDAGDISLFANTSKWLDFLAPGENVVSAVPGSGAAEFDGTSMAAPHVAGAMALLGQAHPEGTVQHLVVAFRKGGEPVFDEYSGLTFRLIDVRGAFEKYDADIVKPTASLAPLPAVTLSTKIPVTWSGADEPGGSGLLGFDLRKRSFRWDGVATAWTNVFTGSSGSLSNQPTPAGWTKCLSVRARDVALNLSPWTAARCTTAPLDDRSLTVKTAGWTDSTSATRYLGTARSAWTPGRQLTRSGTMGKRFWIVATTCPTCGTAAITWNGALTKVVDLRSSTTKHRQVIGVISFPSARSGTVGIITLDSGLVSIDGLAVSRV
jgi:subtilisin family serine protease